MDPARAQALCATLDLPAPGPDLPPFFHHIYFWEAHPPEALGRDGHPAVGGTIPDMGLPRRMWAGGRLEFPAPLHSAIPAEKTTTIENTAHKHGRSGPLGFVTLRHEIRQNGTLCVREFQDLVYRTDPAPDTPRPVPPPAPDGAEETRPVQFSPTLLFRYSALTFNGHRIHYDRDYARDVEGYDGLVVHGPLLAQMLMLMAAEAGPLTRFSFRASAPLMDHEPATLCRAGPRYWVCGPNGRLCMSAEAG
ncbi:acyl dehydratase [Rhodovulum imhoffii]|nr:acyl dehydratase [Rhodovulum imhoffii]MBK5934551.1 acyl dehydratase [Rhodovulum imhoffii]